MGAQDGTPHCPAPEGPHFSDGNQGKSRIPGLKPANDCSCAELKAPGKIGF